MSRAYGLPYKGSKNKIGQKLLNQIPSADIFVDLFAGGCAMSHIALLSDKYKKVIANDINKAPELFLKAINGEFKDEKKWISRDEFHRLKNTDMYIACVWSFGNDLSSYLYSKEIEPYKKAYHHAKVFGDFSLFKEFAPYMQEVPRQEIGKYIRENKEKIKADYIVWYLAKMGLNDIEIKETLNATRADYEAEAERIRLYLRNALKQGGKTQADIDRYLQTQMAGRYFGKSQWGLPTKEAYEKLQEILPLDIKYEILSNRINPIKSRLQSLESLESLERLQSLDIADKLSISNSCYKDFELPKADECVIYCDIPYRNTNKYHHDGKKLDFNHDEFYDWCREKAKQGYKIYISEYQTPTDFKVVFELEHLSILSAKRPNKVVEKLFTL